jgi:hypothetical protein
MASAPLPPAAITRDELPRSTSTPPELGLDHLVCHPAGVRGGAVKSEAEYTELDPDEVPLSQHFKPRVGLEGTTALCMCVVLVFCFLFSCFPFFLLLVCVCVFMCLFVCISLHLFACVCA